MPPKKTKKAADSIVGILQFNATRVTLICKTIQNSRLALVMKSGKGKFPESIPSLLVNEERNESC